MVSMIPQKAEDSIGVLPRHLGFEILELPDSECSAMNSYLDNFFFGGLACYPLVRVTAVW